MLGFVLAVVYDWFAVAHDLPPLSGLIRAFFEDADRFGNGLVSHLAAYISPGSAPVVSPAIFLAVGLTAIWLLLRVGSFFLPAGANTRAITSLSGAFCFTLR
jgi:hypothetical protein